MPITPSSCRRRWCIAGRPRCFGSTSGICRCECGMGTLPPAGVEFHARALPATPGRGGRSSLLPRACLDPAPSAASRSAASRPHSRSSVRSTEWRPTASRTRPDDRAPSEPLALGPLPNTSLASSWLEVLKSWSLRQFRRGSHPRQAADRLGRRTDPPQQGDPAVPQRRRGSADPSGAIPRLCTGTRSAGRRLAAPEAGGYARARAARISAKPVRNCALRVSGSARNRASSRAVCSTADSFRCSRATQ
jgi:hypothetical protein